MNSRFFLTRYTLNIRTKESKKKGELVSGTACVTVIGNALKSPRTMFELENNSPMYTIATGFQSPIWVGALRVKETVKTP